LVKKPDINLDTVEWNLIGINKLLDRLLDDRGIAEANIEKSIELIKLAQAATSRKLLITGINLVNNAKNFETYIVPLVNMGWLSMTIPNKPTSPKQQYMITPKGQLILEILKQSFMK
jgi:ATP-dependent DNA helicase RecG